MLASLYNAALEEMTWLSNSYAGTDLNFITSSMPVLDVTSNTLVLGGDAVTALNATSGEMLWTTHHGLLNGGSPCNQDLCQPWGGSSLAVANGKIYISNGTAVHMLAKHPKQS